MSLETETMVEAVVHLTLSLQLIEILQEKNPQIILTPILSLYLTLSQSLILSLKQSLNLQRNMNINLNLLINHHLMTLSLSKIAMNTNLKKKNQRLTKDHPNHKN